MTTSHNIRWLVTQENILIFSQKYKRYKQQNILLHLLFEKFLVKFFIFSFKKMNEKPSASGQNYLCKAAICTKKDLKDDEVFFYHFFNYKKCIPQPPRRKQSALIYTCFACGGHKMFLISWLQIKELLTPPPTVPWIPQ